MKPVSHLVITDYKKIALEDNIKCNGFTLVWWWVKDGETHEKAIIREAREETWLQLISAELELIEQWKIATSPLWIFQWNTYLYVASAQILDIINDTRENIKIFTLAEIESLWEEAFWIEKHNIIQSIHNALTYEQ